MHHCAEFSEMCREGFATILGMVNIYPHTTVGV